jgi:hypothetical protein
MRQAWRSESRSHGWHYQREPRQHQEANGHCSGRRSEQFDEEPSEKVRFDGRILREIGAEDQGSTLQQKKCEGIKDVAPDGPVKPQIGRFRDSLLAQNEPVPRNRDRCQERQIDDRARQRRSEFSHPVVRRLRVGFPRPILLEPIQRRIHRNHDQDPQPADAYELPEVACHDGVAGADRLPEWQLGRRGRGDRSHHMHPLANQPRLEDRRRVLSCNCGDTQWRRG